ncbi:MAG: hypothetical protein JSR44_12985 [Spirochaetes bacterium]|nr:hypothetical protein [Spirochaetota bacterium]
MNATKNVLCVPFIPRLGDKRANIAELLRLAGELAEAKIQCDVVVLPELSLSGYVLESLTSLVAFEHAEIVELAAALATAGLSPSTEWVIGLPYRDGNEVYNAAVVLCDKKIVHLHKKIFLPTYGMFDEARYFQPGSEFEIYQGALGRTVVLICEDAWHLEMACVALDVRAETVVVISASPARGTNDGKIFASTQRWRNRLQVYAESSAQQYIYCNRGGVEDGILFDGTNFVVARDACFRESTGENLPAQAALYCIAAAAQRHTGFSGSPVRQRDQLFAGKRLSI